MNYIPVKSSNNSNIIPQQAMAHFSINRFIRSKSGTLCADVIVHDPISGKRPRKQVTSKLSEEILQKRIAAAMEDLYLQIRPAFLKCALVGGELTLKRYLSLDLAFLKRNFPKSIGDREITALLQYADALNVELDQCTSANDFLPALCTLKVNHTSELTVLRMVSDSLFELKKLGILSGNPLSAYLTIAKKNANRVKAEQREHSNAALPTYAAAAILNEYDSHILQDARYFAVPLSMLGIPASTISALNLSDIVAVCEEMSLRVDSEMVRPAIRLCEKPLDNTWQVRLLCVNFLCKEIDAWKQKYRSLGVDISAKKLPLCAFGCRAQPKRCSPEEIETFLKELLDRCHLGNHGYTTRAYHKTFLVFGEDLLAEKPLHARYLLGRPPETVDERVYISFTDPRIQREMSVLTEKIFEEIKKGDLSDRVAA